MANKLTKKLHSSNQQERLERKEFELHIKGHAEVLIALLNARAQHASGSRALYAYDEMIRRLIYVHVSDAARERYKQGFTEEQIDAGYAEGDIDTAGVVSSETGMLKALEEMSPWNGGSIHDMLGRYFENLYLWWKYVKMDGLADVEMRSGNGVNRDMNEADHFRGSGQWRFIPLPDAEDCGKCADASGGSVIEGFFPEH